MTVPLHPKNYAQLIRSPTGQGHPEGVPICVQIDVRIVEEAGIDKGRVVPIRGAVTALN